MDAPATIPALEAEKARLIRATRMGIGMPVAGLMFWIAVFGLLSTFRLQGAVYLSFFATGLVFPLGFGLTRLAGGDLFAKSPSLTPLGLQIAAVQLFYWPVIIVLARIAPEWTPYAMAVLFGSHFLPYGWLYRSRGYMVLTILTTLATTATVLVTGGPAPKVVPLVAAGSYLVAILVIHRELAKAMRGQAGD